MANQQNNIKTDISFVKKGMTKDSHASQLSQEEYTHALNTNIEDASGNSFNLTNEQSNVLACKFKTNFIVHGFENDPNSGDTFFLLINKVNGIGELGVIKNNQDINNLEDITINCDDCEQIKKLAEPLETLTQSPLQTYTTLISDAFKEDPKDGFNFNIRYPIKYSTIKVEKLGRVWYFTDNYNSPRFVLLDDIESYFIEQVPCDDDMPVECVDFERLRQFKLFGFPKIKPATIELGGRLRAGVYEFMIAYCDSLGNEISPYYSVTQPVTIFDRNNITLEQKELADRTNFAIKLEITELDQNYSYYKIAVIQTADIEGATRYYIEGIHTINDNIVVYNTEQNKVATSIDKLLIDKLHIEKTEGLTPSNNMLFQWGITQKKEVNLQPIVNLMGQFFKWQTSVANENLYENGIARSLYLGYPRDEVIPLGIRFLEEGGFETPVYPLVARTSTIEDIEELVTEEGEVKEGFAYEDVKSIVGNVNSCNNIGRTKRWQFYNTAKIDSEGAICDSDTVETVEVVERVTKVCVVENLRTSEAGSINIEIDDEEYTTLEDYIQTYKNECPDAFEGTDICEILNANYSGVQCDVDPFEGLDYELISESESIEIGGIDNIVETKVQKSFPSQYTKVVRPTTCYLYKTETQTTEPYATIPLQDSGNQLGAGVDLFVRDSDFQNESCSYAPDIQGITDFLSNTATSYFSNYYFSTLKPSLLTPKDSLIFDADFSNKIHKGALWFKGEIGLSEKTILELSRQTVISNPDELPENNKVRLSIFGSCSDTIAVYSEIVDMTVGGLIKIEKDSTTATTLKITKTNGDVVLLANKWFTNRKYVVAIDSPITTVVADSITKYLVLPVTGCYTLTKRDIEYSSVEVSWDSISVDKKITYIADVTFNQPVVKNCTAVPFKKGIFGYFESTETYPDNQELYDSSKLVVPKNLIPESIKQEFEKVFVKGSNSVNYLLNDNSNLTCKPIRHFKFPDNKVAPFITQGVDSLEFSNTLIYPLGVTVDESIINSFLDIAVHNKILSQEQRSKITKYEIFRGDTTLERSVIASGLLYDMRKYKENNKTVYYSNYPYNTYNKDVMNLDEDLSVDTKGALFGNSNRNYTFHSPETEYYKPTLPTEMSIQGYMFGNSKGYFDEVEDHPKWVILSPKAKRLAATLATLEVLLDTAITAAQSAEVWRVHFGLSNSGNPYGIGLNLFATGLSAISGAVFKYGRFRYEWLKIFRNIGTPNNFAYYYFSDGNYNSLGTLQTEGNYIRGINKAEYLKSGRFIAVNEVTSEKLNINNIDREESVFISIGDSLIKYPEEYKNYDKNQSDSSLFYSSLAGISEAGRSSEIVRKIASPYVALKNFLPSQYGTVNSIKWLTTSYIGNLLNPETGCLSIFGGDTYISRHTLKRKIPLFLTTSMGQANLTPFNYYYYSNIGRNPKFYVSYEIDKDFESSGKLFPDVETDFSMDNLTSNTNYYRPPSKFYLYYYGVPSFLTETRINTNYRYSGKEPKTSFYPYVGDLGEWTQEKNVSIREKNIFLYNPEYSKQVTQNRSRILQNDYNKKVYDTIQDMPNGIIASLPDNNEDSLYDPWLIYRPLDTFQFKSDYGKLKDIIDTENQSVLARFENTSVLYNKVDSKMDTGQAPTSPLLGGNSLFIRRPTTFQNTNLGYGGTQNYNSISNEFGHFYVDTKRGQVIHIPTNGQGMNEISSVIDGKPSGMRNWFKEHLPFKILKYINNVDIDNPFTGVGISMGWDSRYRRLFITKKDYIPLNDCISWDDEKGFVIDEVQCSETTPEASCPEGYTYNEETEKCEVAYTIENLCETGYVYDEELKTCTKVETVNATCICTADVLVENKNIFIQQGDTTNITFTTTSEEPIYYQWVVAESSGVTGASDGTGNSLQQTLNGVGYVKYSVTPFEVSSNCRGERIIIIVNVECSKPDVVVTQLLATYPPKWIVDESSAECEQG